MNVPNHAGDLVVVSPDVGGVARTHAFAKKLSDARLAIVDKWHPQRVCFVGNMPVTSFL
jgi:ribose-phosphate pyrophosphokinase